MAKLSRVVPGGFLSIDGGPGGRLILRMVDTTLADSVRAALLDEPSDLTPEERQLTRARLDSAELRPVPFSMADLYDWNSYLSGLLFAESNRAGVRVTGIGGSPYYGRITVDGATEQDRAWVEERLARANIPCGLVQTQAYGR